MLLGRSTDESGFSEKQKWGRVRHTQAYQENGEGLGGSWRDTGRATDCRMGVTFVKERCGMEGSFSTCRAVLRMIGKTTDPELRAAASPGEPCLPRLSSQSLPGSILWEAWSPWEPGDRSQTTAPGFVSHVPLCCQEFKRLIFMATTIRISPNVGRIPLRVLEIILGSALNCLVLKLFSLILVSEGERLSLMPSFCNSPFNHRQASGL